MTNKKQFQNGQMATEVTVYETTEYDLFELVSANRPIYKTHLRRLKKLIAENNKLKQNPIRVSPEGQVLDGQHRLAAAKALGVPIYYFIDNTGTGIPDIAMENWGVKKWTAYDHLNYWCQQGRKHYLALKDLLDHHEWLTISIAVAICGGRQAGSHLTGTKREDFAMGEWTITNMKFVREFTEAMSDFLAITDIAKHTPFQSAVSYLIKRDDYDHERMMEQIKKHGFPLKKAVDKNEYLRQLEHIYNFHAREESRVRFF